MNLTIRRATVADYPEITRLQNLMIPVQVTVEEFEANEKRRNPDLPYVRFVAESDGRIVGSASGGSVAYLKAGKMWGLIIVDPDVRSQGIGAALCEQMDRFYHEHPPEEIVTMLRGDNPDAIAWAEQRGWVVD